MAEGWRMGFVGHDLRELQIGISMYKKGICERRRIKRGGGRYTYSNTKRYANHALVAQYQK